MNKNSSDVVINNLHKLRRLIECSFNYYTMIKIKELKDIVLHRKISLNSMKIFINNSFNPLRDFGRLMLGKLSSHYSNLNKVKIQSSKSLLKHPYYSKPKIYNISSLKKFTIKINEFLMENKDKCRKDISNNNNSNFIRIVHAEIKGSHIVNEINLGS
jgi:hypothetical protein